MIKGVIFFILSLTLIAVAGSELDKRLAKYDSMIYQAISDGNFADANDLMAECKAVCMLDYEDMWFKKYKMVNFALWGKKAQADVVFDDLVANYSSDPRFSWVMNSAGETCYIEAKYTEAAKYYQAALTGAFLTPLTPSDKWYSIDSQVGLVLSKVRLKEDAAAEANDLAVLYSSEKKLPANLDRIAMIAEEESDYTLAAAMYNRLETSYAAYKPKERAMNQDKLAVFGKINASAIDTATAITSLEKDHKTETQFAVVLSQVGQEYYKKGCAVELARGTPAATPLFNKALIYYTKQRSEYPSEIGDYDSVFYSGEINYKFEKWAACITHYSEYVARWPKHWKYAAKARYRIGKCYENLGDTPNAIIAYQGIIDNNPDSEMVQAAKNKVESLTP